MEPEDDKQLWDVLGRVPGPNLSPFFARNVVRKIRQGATRFERARNWFSLRYRAGAAATAIAPTDGPANGRRAARGTGRPEYGTSARTGRSKHGTFTRTGGSEHT